MKPTSFLASQLQLCLQSARHIANGAIGVCATTDPHTARAMRQIKSAYETELFRLLEGKTTLLQKQSCPKPAWAAPFCGDWAQCLRGEWSECASYRLYREKLPGHFRPDTEEDFTP